MRMSGTIDHIQPHHLNSHWHDGVTIHAIAPPQENADNLISLFTENQLLRQRLGEYEQHKLKLEHENQQLRHLLQQR